MPPYNQIHAEYLAYILLGGGVLTLLLWLAVGSRHWTVTTRKLREQDYEAEVHQFGEVREGHRNFSISPGGSFRVSTRC